MTNRAMFWIVLAIVIFPVLLLLGLFSVIVPGLNLMLIPVWSLAAMSYVGGFSNEIERCRRLAQRAPAALRNAPGVIAVHRVNAL